VGTRSCWGTSGPRLIAVAAVAALLGPGCATDGDAETAVLGVTLQATDTAAQDAIDRLTGDLVFHGRFIDHGVEGDSTSIERPAAPSARADPNVVEAEAGTELLSCSGFVQAGDRPLLLAGTVTIELIVDGEVAATRSFELERRLEPQEAWTFDATPSSQHSAGAWDRLSCRGTFAPGGGA